MPSTNCKRKELFKLGSSIAQTQIEFVKKSKVNNDEKSEEVIFCSYITSKTLAQ